MKSRQEETEPKTRGMLRPLRRGKASLPAPSSFSISKKAAVCPPTITPISAFGPKNSPAPVIIRVFIAQVYRSRKRQTLLSPQPTTFATRPHQATSRSGPTTFSALRRQAALFHQTRLRLNRAVSATPQCGNSRNPPVRGNSARIALRTTLPTATATHRVTPRTSGSSTSTRPRHRIPPEVPNDPMVSASPGVQAGVSDSVRHGIHSSRPKDLRGG